MVEIDQTVLVVVISLAAVVLAVGIILIVMLFKLNRELRETIFRLNSESMPMIKNANILTQQAASELERVGDVIEATEAVSATVDSASRFAYRMFANPIVKTVAFATGFRKASNRLFSPEKDR